MDQLGKISQQILVLIAITDLIGLSQHLPVLSLYAAFIHIQSIWCMDQLINASSAQQGVTVK